VRERDKFDVPLAQWRHLGKLRGLGRKRPKKTPVYELAFNETQGLHLRKLVSRPSTKNVRRMHAFECMDPDCFLDFRLRESKDPSVLQHGRQVCCPACGSFYVEWLSFEVDPSDVYLRNDEEEGFLPEGALGKRRTLGVG
jgi:hypothetical protein